MIKDIVLLLMDLVELNYTTVSLIMRSVTTLADDYTSEKSCIERNKSIIGAIGYGSC